MNCWIHLLYHLKFALVIIGKSQFSSNQLLTLSIGEQWISNNMEERLS